MTRPRLINLKVSDDEHRRLKAAFGKGAVSAGIREAVFDAIRRRGLRRQIAVGIPTGDGQTIVRFVIDGDDRVLIRRDDHRRLSWAQVTDIDIDRDDYRRVGEHGVE